MGKPFKPLPMEFLVDGRDSPPDSLTACFPRSARQAFGHYAGSDPLPSRLTFQQPQHGAVWPALAFVAVLVIVCAVAAK